MVFPGITKLFVRKELAMEYLNEPLENTEKLLKVLFKVTVDVQGDVKPMDAKKFLGDDPAAQGKYMADALIQRCMVQVQSYSIEGPDGEDVSADSILKKIEEKGGAPYQVPEIFKMTHIIHVRQLDNEKDPNTATNVLDYGKKETWEKFVKTNADKKIEEVTK